jgi:hypothetical protein
LIVKNSMIDGKSGLGYNETEKVTGAGNESKNNR